MINRFKEKFISYKTPFFYTGSSIIKALASIAGSFFIAKYVEPEDLGLWSTISLALSYSVFLQGGIVNGLNLELPYSFGKGNKDEAEKMASVTQTYIVIISLIIFVIGSVITFYFPLKDEKVKWGILAVTILICCTFYQNYLLSTFRSNNAFLRLSYIQLIESFFTILALGFIAYYFYYGMILRSVIVICIYLVFLHYYRPMKVPFLWDKKIFLNLLKVGLPIFALAYVELFAATIDKLWLIKYSNLTEVGLYSFGLYSLTVITLFSTSLASYIYPRMTYNYGLNNNKTILWKYVKKITIVVFIILFPLVCIGYLILPYLVETFFPNYILSIRVMQILLFAGLFKGCVIGVNILWSMRKWKFMIIYQISYASLLISLTYFCFRVYGSTIEGIAMGVLFANITNFSIGLLLSYLAIKPTKLIKNKMYFL